MHDVCMCVYACTFVCMQAYGYVQRYACTCIKVNTNFLYTICTNVCMKKTYMWANECMHKCIYAQMYVPSLTRFVKSLDNYGARKKREKKE